jgi:hypothetical protein
VIFTLLLLIAIPLLTGVLITLDQRQLMEATEQARSHLLALNKMTRTTDRTAEAWKQQDRLDKAVEELNAQQNRVQARSEKLRTFQFTLTLSLGFLGLLACWYTRHAVTLMRDNMAELAIQRAESQTRSEQTATLANVTAAINSSLDMQDTLTVFGREARSLIPFQRLSLALYPGKQPHLEWISDEEQSGPQAEIGEERAAETDLIRRIRGRHMRRPNASVSEDPSRKARVGGVPDSDTPCLELWSLDEEGHIARKTQPLIETDLLSGVLRQGKAALAAESSKGTTLVVPLIVHNVVIGALQLESRCAPL